MLPTDLAWIRTTGSKLNASLRHRLLTGCRPPRWLPCWFHRSWYNLARLQSHDVIIGLEGGAGAVTGILRKHGCREHHHLKSLGQICARVRPDTLSALCQCSGVTRLWLDREVRALLDVALPSANRRRVGSRQTGQGVTIAVLDTGIYPHPDLHGRILGFADFVGDQSSPYDDNGHGTHVAGCAAGDGAASDSTYLGAAPEALLVGVKVLNKQGQGRMSDLLAGIDWVIQQRERYQIRILNISLGATAEGRCQDDPLCMAVDRAWQEGIVVVAAAGHEGPTEGSVATPGISPALITVGAMREFPGIFPLSALQ